MYWFDSTGSIATLLSQGVYFTRTRNASKRSICFQPRNINLCGLLKLLVFFCEICGNRLPVLGIGIEVIVIRAGKLSPRFWSAPLRE